MAVAERPGDAREAVANDCRANVADVHRLGDVGRAEVDDDLRRVGDGRHAVGQSVAIGLVRDGMEMRVAATLVAPPETPPRDVSELRGIARQLEERRIETRRGGTWTAVQVASLLKRLDRVAA
mgnify:CR=1 FL=1